jgi:glycosyltransferase involved in cell wall biosynthesis
MSPMTKVATGPFIPRQRGTLRVVHLDHSTSAGGAELALLRMLRSEPEWCPTVVVPRPRRACREVFEPIADSVVAVGPRQRPGASKDGHYVFQAVNLLRVLAAAICVRRSRPFRDTEVVHANTARAAVYGALACARTEKAFVVHLRDTVDRPSLGRFGLRLFLATGLRRADGLIANSETTLRSVERYGPDVPRVVIPSAAGLHRHDAVRPVRARVERIGMVARIDHWKGHAVVLRAFATAFGDTPVRLGFAGGAPFGNEPLVGALKDLARELGVAAQVDFLGHVTDVDGFVDDQDICVQASTRPEPLGQNVLQYLSAGRPTVAVAAGGPAEWILDGVNGLLYEMGSVEALAERLRSLAADPALRARLGCTAARTPGLLSDAEVARRTAGFFHEVVRRKHGGDPPQRRPSRRERGGLNATT